MQHIYQYEVDPNSDTAAARVIRMVGQGKRVLEIGPGPGSITRLLLKEGNCRVTGVEIDSDAIEIVAEFCERVFQADLNDSSWPQLLREEGRFEVIVAADVLEHLYDPWSTLTLMKQFVQDDGYIVISLPHVGYHGILACLLEEDFEYRDWGLMDRSHIRFFGIKNIEKLFQDAGLKIVEAQFVIVQPELSEFAKKWRRIPTDVRRALSANRFGLVYQVVVKAVPSESQAKEVSLLSMSVELPTASRFPVYEFLKSQAHAHLKEENLKMLRRIARRLGIR